MSSISKISNQSLSSGFSSFSNERFQPILTHQTVLNIQRADINARSIFCGEQDCRLNDLRHMTNAIIDLSVVQGTRCAFERVNWTISHRNTEVCAFVVRRLNYWAQQTQIACDMSYDDAVFLQEQREKQIKKPPPLTTANFGRRYRTRSLTQSGPTNLNGNRDSIPSTPTGLTYKHETPFVGLLGRTLLTSRYPQCERLYTPQINYRRREDMYSNHVVENIEMSSSDNEQLMERAKWAGVLSDSSDNELNENRVCFADTISLSKLAEMLRNNELQSTSDICEIDMVIQQSTMNVTSREQMRQFDGKSYWFHRVILDGHIQFPAGISHDANQARQLAYRHMIDVCLNNGGVKMKMLTNNRVKVVKGPKLEEQNHHNTDELDMNGNQFGIKSTTNNDESTIPLTNEHTTQNFYNNNYSSSILPLFANIKSLFHSHYKPSESYELHSNGIIKHENNNLIYHQLDIQTINDENNNDTNQNSVLLHMPSNHSNESPDNKYSFLLFFKENFISIILISLIYFSWFIFIAGISIVHILIYSVLFFLCSLSDRTRRFALAILIYLTYLLLYDALHLIPNYTVSNIHIQDIYLIEKKFFGINKNGHMITLNEYFRQNHIPLLDILTGICYLHWIPIPVAYSLYLYRYKTKRDYMDFAFTFLLTNILGFVVYYIIPAAPPWYIELYGFEFNINARGNPAGFIHFDQITGLKIFSSMYSKNANVFAAIPSLHAAYPLITVLYGSLSKRLWLHIVFVIFTLSVWFSAVYSRHHYVIDVIAGGMCAITAFVLYRIISRIPTINRWLVLYSKSI
ncbi:unnamed protein product [Adineta steineri]|uniref:Phosphatidic acid phosphatase type 2/haloperoxidase domain-containing protein n=1 Tax=Adineta steineri TaxID=433720 RepID=A0A813TZ20_9BILA|nr:unnamed protein product [Adineta steineri]CAF3869099.1 unnamed protein product [Adineta steineri]